MKTTSVWSIPTDALKTFTNLRRSLETQRVKIIARLQAINAALGSAPPPSIAIPKPGTAMPVAPTGRGRRAKGGLSLKVAVVKATLAKPLTKDEIYAAVKKLGYRFTTKKPMASIKVVLYGREPKFRNEAGKFSPA